MKHIIREALLVDNISVMTDRYHAKSLKTEFEINIESE